MNPAYHAAVAREARNRLLAYLHDAEPLVLPLLGGGTFPFPVVTLTWRHLQELGDANNAFFVPGTAPLRGDFFRLLCRLHPWYRTPMGRQPNLDLQAVSEGQLVPGRFRCWIARYLVRRYCARLDIRAAEPIVRQRINDCFQDMPADGEGDGQDTGSALSARATWFEFVASRFAEWGHSREYISSCSVAWTFQMLRVEGIENGREERYIPPSAALIGDPPSA